MATKSTKPKNDTRVTTFRVDTADYKRAAALVAKIKLTEPGFTITEFMRDGFTRELDRRSPGRTTVTTYNAKELASVLAVLTPQEVPKIKKVFDTDPAMTPHLFLKSAIENEVSRRLLTKNPPKLTLEKVSKQLENVLELLTKDNQGERKTALLTELIAQELGITVD